MADEIKGMNIKIGGDCSDLTKAFKAMNDDIKKTQSNLNSVNKLLKLDPENTELVATKQKILTEAVDKTTEKFKELDAMQDQVQEAYDKGNIPIENYLAFQKELQNTKNKMNSLNEELNLMSKTMEENEENTEDFSDNVNDTSNSLEKLDDKSKDTQQSVKDLGDTSIKAADIFKAGFFSNLAVESLKKLGEACKNASKYVAGVGMDYTAAMSQVAATAGMTSEDINNGSLEFEKLSEAAKLAGSTTKYSATEAAEALNYLALAGYDVDKSVETLPRVLTFAAAANMELGAASDMVTDTMSALKLETDDLDGYMDMMAKTAQKSNTNVAQLGEGILECGGTVDSTGQSIDDMCTSLGILANNGIKGAEGGTHLRNILLSLTAPTDTAKEKMDELGLSVANSDGSIRGINEIMTDFSNILGDMSDSQKTEVLSEIFNKTDLNAVNALLNGTSGAFEDLNNEINNADGACSNMADTMQNNLSGKVTIFQSSLEALGLSIYDKFDEPMQDAVGGATERINELSESIESGALSDDFDKLSNSTSKFIDKALDIGETALPKIINGISWLMEHSNLIVGLLAGIQAKSMTMKTVEIVQSAVSSYQSFKNALVAAESAQAGLNATQMATPWGLIASAVGLVAGSLAAYITQLDETMEAEVELSDEQQELVDNINSTSEALNDQINSRKENMQKVSDECDSYSLMVDKLKELNKAEELSNESKAEMQSIVNELNEAMPELNLVLDEETGHLKNNTDAIYETIEAQKEKLLAQAAEEEMTDILKNQVKAQRELDEVKPEYEKERAELERLKKEYDNFLVKYKDYDAIERDQYYGGAKMREEIKKQEERVGQLATSYLTASNNVKGLQKEYDYLTTYLTENKSPFEEEKEAINESLSVLGEYKTQTDEYSGQIFKATDETMAKIDELNQQYAEAVEKREEEISNNLDRFSKFNEGTEISAEDMMKNLESNLEGVASWADDLEKLADKGVNQGLIRTLQEAGPSSTTKIRALLNMSKPELDKYSQMWADLDTEIHDTAVVQAQRTNTDLITEINNLISDSETTFNEKSLELSQTLHEVFKDCGANVVEGIANGITTRQGIAIKAIDDMSGQIANAFRLANRINSPSKLYTDLAGFIPLGAALGIENNADAAINAVQAMSEEMLNSANMEIANATAREVYSGRYIQRIVRQEPINKATPLQSYSESPNYKFPENITLVTQLQSGETLAKVTYPFIDLMMGNKMKKIQRGGAV